MNIDQIARLKELASLRDAGILSPDEFDEQKAAILREGRSQVGGTGYDGKAVSSGEMENQHASSASPELSPRQDAGESVAAAAQSGPALDATADARASSAVPPSAAERGGYITPPQKVDETAKGPDEADIAGKKSRVPVVAILAVVAVGASSGGVIWWKSAEADAALKAGADAAVAEQERREEAARKAEEERLEELARQPKIEFSTGKLRRSPDWSVRHVEADDSCSRLTDYCVQVRCTVQSNVDEPQSGEVLLTYSSGMKRVQATVAAHMPELISANFYEARLLDSAGRATCSVPITESRVSCKVANTGGSVAKASVYATPTYETGVEWDNRQSVDVYLSAGDSKWVSIDLPPTRSAREYLDPIVSAECSAELSD